MCSCWQVLTCDSVLKIVKLTRGAFIASTWSHIISTKEQFFMDVFFFHSPFEMISIVESAHSQNQRVSPGFNGAINMFRFNTVVIWNVFPENGNWRNGFSCSGVQLHMLAAELYRDPPPSHSCSATLSRLID